MGRESPRASLRFETEQGSNWYHMRLVHAAGDTLIFADESVTFHRKGEAQPREQSLGAGHKETMLTDTAFKDNQAVKVARGTLSSYRVFHFHDTSDTSRMRGNTELENNRYRMSDGGNLAAILYKLQQARPQYYERIVNTIRQIAPFFEDFVLFPRELDPRYIQLRWRDRNEDYEFGPHQLSDGTLRAMALVTLLLQPKSDLPGLIVLDEPELGLHPYAITLIAGLIRSAAAAGTQFVLATQSTALLDHFDPEDVIVAEQHEGKTVFEHPSVEQLAVWLEDYTLSELWEKNVIGGTFTSGC